jgi:hypothetical protein
MSFIVSSFVGCTADCSAGADFSNGCEFEFLWVEVMLSPSAELLLFLCLFAVGSRDSVDF